MPGILLMAACLIAVTFAGCSQPQSYDTSHKARPKDAQSEFDVGKGRPPTEKTLITMADILGAQGKDRQCEFVLRRCIQDYPQFMPAYNRLAEVLMRQGRVNDAAVTLSAAVQVCPTDPVLVNNLGMCLIVGKEYGNALDHFTQAAGLQPENRKYRANMATALGLLGRQEESLALLQQCLADEQADHNAEVLREASTKAIDASMGGPG